MVDTIGTAAIQARSYSTELRGAGSSSGSNGAGTAARPSQSDASTTSPDADPVTQVLERYRSVPYLSPRLRVDEAISRVIVEYRNPDTGDVERQFPSKQQIKKYEVADQAARAAESRAAIEPNGKNAETAAPLTGVSGQAATTSVVANSKAPETIPAPVAEPVPKPNEPAAQTATNSTRGVIA